jgi:FkbM family methyltransferase
MIFFKRFSKRINTALVSGQEMTLRYAIRFLVLFNLNSEPLFVKVGAHDGMSGDLGDIFLRLKRWRGYLIEPIPYLYTRLLSKYGQEQRFQCDQIAISEKKGYASMYFLPDDTKKLITDLPSWWDQLGSLDAGHIKKHLGNSIAAYIKAIKVPTMTLCEYLNRYSINSVDFLHIDAEGHDCMVLNSLDLNLIKPSIIMLEIKHLSENQLSDVYRKLKESNYEFVHASRTDLLSCKTGIKGIIALNIGRATVLLMELIKSFCRC